MKHVPGKLRIVAILLALLPGLLIRGGDPLRVCLHTWFGFTDGCTAMVSAAADSGCCSSRPTGPTVSGSHECEGCCFEISAGTEEIGLKAPMPDAYAAQFALPPARVLGLMAPPLHREIALHRALLLVAPPGRAPSPLRI